MLLKKGRVMILIKRIVTMEIKETKEVTEEIMEEITSKEEEEKILLLRKKKRLKDKLWKNFKPKRRPKLITFSKRQK